MEDQDKELIRFLTEVLKLLAVLLIAVVGGALTAIANKPDSNNVNGEGVRNVFIIFGFGLGILLGYCIYELQSNIRKILRNTRV